MPNEKHNVVLAGAGDAVETQIREGIGTLVNIVATHRSPTAIVPLITEKNPDIVILYLDEYPSEILAAAKEISLHAGLMVIIVSSKDDPQNILMSMRSGARDFAFLSPDNTDDLMRAINELAVLKNRISNTGHGTVISVFGAKGGCGATTIAANLAGVLLDQHMPSGKIRNVAILDFDMEMGDVLAFLDLKLNYTFSDVYRNMHRLETDIIRQTLTVHSSGLCVLAQTDNVAHSEEIGIDDLHQVLPFLRQHFDFIVIDGIRGFNELSIMALDNSQHVLLTATPDIPSLKNANRCLQLFHKLSYDEHKVKLIINRFEKSKTLTVESIADALARPIDGTVGNHYPSVIKSINEGKLLIQSAPKSRIAKDIRQFANMFVQPEAPKRRSFFNFRRV